MKEWGTSVALSPKAMTWARRNGKLSTVVIPSLRYSLERKGCTNITISEPDLEDLYESYDEDGRGIGEPVPTWTITAIGETDA